MSEAMILRFPYPPRTFVEVAEYSSIWEAPERRAIGVYLWCIEYAGSLWVNYVGKAAGAMGFEGRLWTELKRWHKGLDLQPVELDAFLTEHRIRLAAPPSDYLEQSLKLLEPRYRILMAPLSTPAECSLLEGALVNALRRHTATEAFLSNKDKAYGYKRGRNLTLKIVSSSLIWGLNNDPDRVTLELRQSRSSS